MKNEFKNELELIRKHYAEVTDLELIYISLAEVSGEFITPKCSFCRAVSSNADGRRACINQRRIFAMEALNKYAPTINICPSGLVVWSIPVYHNKELKGLLLSGFAVSINGGDASLASQADSFNKLFGIPQNDVKKYYPMINKIEPSHIEPLADLLFSLTRMFIDPGMSCSKQVIAPIHSDVIPFTEGIDTDLSPYDKPFSFYTSACSFPEADLELFWKLFETRTTDIFINLMGGMIIRARSIYSEIMEMAYRENNIDQIKTSSIHIYHIMTMKFFSKKLFDINMYGLLDDTIKALLHSSSLKEIKDIMDQTFTRMCHIYHIGNHRTEPDLVDSIIQYIEDNFHRQITVGGIAKNVHISAEYLSRLFKKKNGFTIKWCINTIRMNHAQKMLIYTDTPVNKIGHAVGYDDMRAFYKMFSKQFGITPSELRNRYSELHR